MRETIVDACGKRVLVGDGALGTELMKRCLAPGACPELMSIEQPEVVLAVSRSYADAGADFLHTNTLGANRWTLVSYGLEAKVRDFNAAAVDIARRAARGRLFVVGEMGPTGRFVAPLGEDPPDAFREVFAEQAGALAAAGADAILLETFTALDEALSALEAARETGLPVIASVGYSRTAAGDYRTVMGHGIREFTSALEDGGADVIGANCAMGADAYPALVRELVRAASRPVMVQPNAGMPELLDGKTVFPMNAGEFAAHVPAIVEAGARIIGGCCGTTSDHVREIRRAVDAWHR